MKKTSETITFFGSGPVAARSLELLAQNFSIEAVITKPKPAHHHGDFPVIELAEKLELPILTVSDAKSLDELMASKPVNSRLAVLVDFGIIVSQRVIDYFPLGIVNSHFSLLPQWRGADPITFAILNGDKETGVSLMLLVEKMDEGPLLAQQTLTLPKTITTPELTDKLITLSDELLRSTLPEYIEGRLQPIPQDDATPSYSRKLTKDDSRLDWQKPAEQLEREVRAFRGWPKSRTTLGSKEVVITKAQVVGKQLSPGKLEVTHGHIVVGTRDKALEILELTPSGKSPMSAQAFLAGYSLS